MAKKQEPIDPNNNDSHLTDVPKKFRRMLSMKKQIYERSTGNSKKDPSSCVEESKPARRTTDPVPTIKATQPPTQQQKNATKLEIIHAIKKSKRSSEKHEKTRSRLQNLKEKKRQRSTGSDDDDNTVIVNNKHRRIMVNKKDDIKFGDVVTEPPKLTTKPRINAKTASSLLQRQQKSKQPMSLRAQELLDKERQLAIDRYRLLRAQQEIAKQ